MPSLSASSWPYDHKESRTLEFYQDRVAQALPRRDWPDFWTSAVLQMGEHHAAIRHITLAISSLFEDLDNNEYESGARNSYAVKQYNTAIGELVKCEDVSTAFVASRMFIAADFAMGNIAGAILHNDYGPKLLKNDDAQTSFYFERFSVPFQLINILKSYFVECRDSSQARIPAFGTWWLQAIGASRDSRRFGTPGKNIISQAVQFVQVVEANGARYHAVPPHILRVQASLLAELDQHLESCEARLKQDITDLDEDFLLRERHLKDLVSKICLGSCLSQDDSVFIEFKREFETIIELAPTIDPNKKLQRPASLQAEMDSRLIKSQFLVPILCFVVIQCRHVKLQMRAMMCIYAVGNLEQYCYSPPPSQV
jgi:hypothetical protein